MARMSNPSLKTVWEEFGPTNRPNDLRTMYQRVFGTVIPGTSSLRSFHGFGKPEISNIETTPGSQLVHVDFDFDDGGRPSDFRVQYADNVSFNNPQATPWQINQPSDSYRVTVTGLTNGVSYAFRVQARNGFCDQSINDAVTSVSYEGTPVGGILTPPSGLSITSYSAGVIYAAQWFTGTPEPTGYRVEYNLNGGVWQNAAITEVGGSWPGAGQPKQGNITVQLLPNPGDEFQFRIRGTRANYQDSPWSNIATYNH